jgi:DNA-binding Xre family transcriptional regulator
MSPNQAFDFVMTHYQINADEIAQASGIHKTAISKFRNGHHAMNSDNLQKLIKSLPPKAIAHFNVLAFYSDAEEKKSELKVPEEGDKYIYK